MHWRCSKGTSSILKVPLIVNYKFHDILILIHCDSLKVREVFRLCNMHHSLSHSVKPSIQLSFCLSVCPSIHSSVYYIPTARYLLTSYLSTHPPVLIICPSVPLSIHLPIQPFIDPSIPLSLHDTSIPVLLIDLYQLINASIQASFSWWQCTTIHQSYNKHIDEPYLIEESSLRTPGAPCVAVSSSPVGSRGTGRSQSNSCLRSGNSAACLPRGTPVTALKFSGIAYEWRWEETNATACL